MYLVTTTTDPQQVEANSVEYNNGSFFVYIKVAVDSPHPDFDTTYSEDMLVFSQDIVASIVRMK